ncbi:MAG: DUF3108 domain-containing protein [Sulfurovum sp.]|nr:DUF3108 domain-containing protein [Sulfurovum sp.]
MRKLWIIIGLCFSLTSFTFSQTIQLNYKATFGIFGTVGSIHNTLTKTNKTYKIKSVVKLAGLAKMMLGNQKETYISKGHMEKGLMVSDFYEMRSEKKNKKKVKTYLFDHKKRTTTKNEKVWREGKLTENKTQTLHFYAKDDLLTLYFNLGTALKEKGKTYTFKAVGLEKQRGTVKITVPNNAQLKGYKKDLGNTAHLYAKALIHQKNFKKKKGDILLAIGKDGFIQKSVIKDVLLYGDAQLVRIK